MLHKLTIIIPSYERHDYLKKNIYHWNGSDVKVIILDGSKKKLKKNFKIKSNINYFHLPNKSLFQRLGFASKIIKTKYSMLCCDDEFYIESGLLKCLEELEKNKELSCAMGRVLCFRFRDNKKLLTASLGYGQFKNYYLDISDPLQRVKKHLSGIMGRPTMYSVTRSKFFIEILNLVSKSEIFPCQQTYELQSDISLSFYGKIKFIENLTWLRNFDELPLWPRGVHFFENWYLNKKSRNEVKKLILLTSKSLYSINKQNNLKEISQTIKYVLTKASYKALKDNKKIFKIWSSKIAPIIIFVVKKIINDKAVYYIKKIFNIEVDIEDSAKKLSSQGVKYSKLELKKVIKIICN